MKRAIFLLLFFVSALTVLFGQANSKEETAHSKYYWKTKKIYNDSNELKYVIKTKRLFLFDPTTRYTRCYMKIIKYYEKGVVVKKEYITITEGGCRRRRHIENKYTKRFPNFTVYKFKVYVLWNLGIGTSLYQQKVHMSDTTFSY